MFRRDTCELFGSAVATCLLILAITWIGVVQVNTGKHFGYEHQLRKQEHQKIINKEDNLKVRLDSIDSDLRLIRRQLEALNRR
jgi:hypothetical protein